jgi:hypothetical protein
MLGESSLLPARDHRASRVRPDFVTRRFTPQVRVVADGSVLSRRVKIRFLDRRRLRDPTGPGLLLRQRLGLQRSTSLDANSMNRDRRQLRHARRDRHAILARRKLPAGTSFGTWKEYRGWTLRPANP